MAADSSDGATERTRKRNDLAGKIYKVVKCGVVGDGTVGKSCLLMTYTMAGFVEHYVPTIFDNFSVLEDFDGKLVNITLWDTAGQDDYLPFRTTTCYRGTDIFLVCFSTVNHHSFQNVKQKWIPELQNHSPNTPIILCGTQTDLRSDEATLAELARQGTEPISTKLGQKRAKEIKALTYVECSARDVSSVINVFRQTITFLLDKDAKQRIKVQKQYKKELALEKKYEKQLAKKAAAEGTGAAAAASS